MAPVGLLEAKERGTRNVVVTDIYQGTSRARHGKSLWSWIDASRTVGGTIGVKWDCRCQAFEVGLSVSGIRGTVGVRHSY